MNNKEIGEQINNIYLNLRNKAESRVDYFEGILFSDPKYKENNIKIQELELESYKKEYLGISSNIDYNYQIDKLKKENLQIQNSLNIKDTDLTPQYKCKKCDDTGLSENKLCDCYYTYYNKIVLDYLGKDDKLNVTTHSIPKGLEKHYEIFDTFVQKFPNTNLKNFIFTGKTGTGKSYLSKVISTKIKNNGYIVVFLNAISLNDLFFKIHRNAEDSKIILDILQDCDLLVIDDLGTEPIYKNVTIEYLLMLLSYRLNENKHFIISTNLTLNEIKDRYDERIFSRLNDKNTTGIINFNIDDLRYHNDKVENK